MAELHGRQAEAYQRVRRRFVMDLGPAATQAPAPLAKLPRKCAAFDDLPLAQLMQQLERYAKRTFTARERGEWASYLTSEIDQLAIAKRQIKDETEDLNRRVYALYGLSEEQRRRIVGIKYYHRLASGRQPP